MPSVQPPAVGRPRPPLHSSPATQGPCPPCLAGSAWARWAWRPGRPPSLQGPWGREGRFPVTSSARLWQLWQRFSEVATSVVFCLHRLVTGACCFHREGRIKQQHFVNRVGGPVTAPGGRRGAGGQRARAVGAGRRRGDSSPPTPLPGAPTPSLVLPLAARLGAGPPWGLVCPAHRGPRGPGLRAEPAPGALRGAVRGAAGPGLSERKRSL